MLPAYHIRTAKVADLPALNLVVERALMLWTLPERVKRLALSSYQYQPVDFDHMTLVAAQTGDGEIIAVAGWEGLDPGEAPHGAKALLLHGIYVLPDWRHHGIGRALLAHTLRAARDGGYEGVLVKAQSDAEGFFRACGMEPLPIQDGTRDYALRYWKAVKA